MNSRIAFAIALTASIAVAGPAKADGWYCTDVIEEAGARSSMTQHFHPDRRPLGGPYQVLSAANFSTGWYNKYPSLAEPFAYPDDVMLTIPTGADRSRIRYGVLRAGSEELRLDRFDRWTHAAIGLRAKGKSEVRSLLAHRDWNVSFYDGSDRLVEETRYSLALTVPELEALYARHLARIQEMGKDVDQRCEPDDVEIVT